MEEPKNKDKIRGLLAQLPEIIWVSMITESNRNETLSLDKEKEIIEKIQEKLNKERKNYGFPKTTIHMKGEDWYLEIETTPIETPPTPSSFGRTDIATASEMCFRLKSPNRIEECVGWSLRRIFKDESRIDEYLQLWVGSDRTFLTPDITNTEIRNRRWINGSIARQAR